MGIYNTAQPIEAKLHIAGIQVYLFRGQEIINVEMFQVPYAYSAKINVC